MYCGGGWAWTGKYEEKGGCEVKRTSIDWNKCFGEKLTDEKIKTLNDCVEHQFERITADLTKILPFRTFSHTLDDWGKERAKFLASELNNHLEECIKAFEGLGLKFENAYVLSEPPGHYLGGWWGRISFHAYTEKMIMMNYPYGNADVYNFFYDKKGLPSLKSYSCSGV